MSVNHIRKKSPSKRYSCYSATVKNKTMKSPNQTFIFIYIFIYINIKVNFEG